MLEFTNIDTLMRGTDTLAGTVAVTRAVLIWLEGQAMRED